MFLYCSPGWTNQALALDEGFHFGPVFVVGVDSPVCLKWEGEMRCLQSANTTKKIMKRIW